MKKFAVILAALLLFSLGGCSQKPTTEEVEAAIQSGNLTVEDALEKGWVTQEWVDSYNQARVVPATDKLSAYSLEDFTTTDLNGEEFTKEDLTTPSFFAFIDPSDADAADFYQNLLSASDSVQQNGAQIVLCVKGEENLEAFSDATFPVIRYNDSLKQATQEHSEMIEGIPNTASWYANGAFLSAWYSSVNPDELGEDAKSYVEMTQQTPSSEETKKPE